MLLLWVPAFPALLLLSLLALERLEARVALGGLSADLADVLTRAQVEEVEAFVAAGFKPALDDYWRGRRPLRRVGSTT